MLLNWFVDVRARIVLVREDFFEAWRGDEVYFDGGLRYNRERKKFSLESVVTSLGDGSFNAIPKETTARTWKGLTVENTLACEPGGDVGGDQAALRRDHGLEMRPGRLVAVVEQILEFDQVFRCLVHP